MKVIISLSAGLSTPAGTLDAKIRAEITRSVNADFKVAMSSLKSTLEGEFDSVTVTDAKFSEAYTTITASPKLKLKKDSERYVLRLFLKAKIDAKTTLKKAKVFKALLIADGGEGKTVQVRAATFDPQVISKAVKAAVNKLSSSK